MTIEKMKIGYNPGQQNERNSAPRKPGDNHYFEVNPEYEDRDRSRKRGAAPEELEKELIRREKEIALIKQTEREFDRQYKITSNRDQPIGGNRGTSKPYEQSGQTGKPHHYSEHKMQAPWGTGPLPRVSEPRTIPNHSTGGNPGRLAHTFSGFDGPLQPVQPPARMAAITSLPGQFQTPVSATQQSSGNLGNKKTTPFSRELNTLDSQIDKTEAEIQRIRQNIESLQTQFRDQKIEFDRI